jgi:hypothetical protein
MAVEQGGATERLCGGNHAATLATAAAWEHPRYLTLKAVLSAVNGVLSDARST